MPRRNSEQRLLSAINCIYATTTGEVSWSVALESVCDFIGARAADLNVGKPITMEYLAFHPARVDPFVLQYMADYMADVKNENPRVHRIYQPMAEGCIVADSDIWTPQEQARMSFFADFLQPWGTHDSLNTWVRRGTDGLPWIALAIHFSKAKCPPQAEERRRLGLLLPHIRRAFGVEEQLEGAIQSKHGLQEMLDHTREAALLLWTPTLASSMRTEWPCTSFNGKTASTAGETNTCAWPTATTKAHCCRRWTDAARQYACWTPRVRRQCRRSLCLRKQARSA